MPTTHLLSPAQAAREMPDFVDERTWGRWAKGDKIAGVVRLPSGRVLLPRVSVEQLRAVRSVGQTEAFPD